MILPAREGYRRWASTYEQAPNPIVSLIDRHLDFGVTDGKRIIDVACGTGRRAASMGALGVDLSFEMLSRGRGCFVQADAFRLPFADASADVVLCILALGYLAPVRAAMSELRRIAGRGAAIIAADVHPQAIAAGWKRSFRDGDAVYEVENRGYTFDDLAVDDLQLDSARDLYFGEPERIIYANAGKPGLFDCEIPAAWIRRWIRR